MLLKAVVNSANAMGTPVGTSSEELRKWHSHEDSFPFLLHAQTGDVPIYLSCKGLIAISSVVPIARLDGDYIRKFLDWSFMPSGGYGYGMSGDEVFLSGPYDSSGLGAIEGTTPIFFHRYFAGYENHRNYVEIDQVVSHALDIHWVEAKQAWCAFNNLGEVVPIAKIHSDDDMTCCTLAREELDFYLFLADAVLVRFFEFNRFLEGRPPRKANEYSEPVDAENEIYAKRTVYGDASNPDCLSFLRGFQIIRYSKSREEMVARLHGQETREYATFLIHDWKHKRVIEWSSAPDQIGNYFVSSGLPFGTSPAFFKPDVLAQYRQDPSRYVIGDRTIECRHAWSLRYDVNEENQVHVYLCDLSKLPHQEQLHWKAFNETPRAGISKRAIKTDFEASWDEEYDPLVSLKRILHEFPPQDATGKPCPIWRLPKLPPTRDLDFLSYVLTESRKEWEDQMLALAQVLVEGLNTKFINKLAETLNCRDTTLGSIKQLGKILESLSVAEVDRSTILGPIGEIWGFRSSGIAHAGRDRPTEDLRTYYRALLRKCDEAMRKLAELVQSGILSV